jgi:ElaB/YqjD/DUF883 family membrane-anchored ribosome-binding protein
MSSAANQTVVRLKDFRDEIADSVQNWTSKARSAAKTTDGFVRSSPWQAVGAVALVGAAAGLVLSLGARRARQRAAANRPDVASEMSGG